MAIFDLGIRFKNIIKFRKVVAKYAIEYKVQLKLRPSEKEEGNMQRQEIQGVVVYHT